MEDHPLARLLAGLGETLPPDRQAVLSEVLENPDEVAEHLLRLAEARGVEQATVRVLLDLERTLGRELAQAISGEDAVFHAKFAKKIRPLGHALASLAQERAGAGEAEAQEFVDTAEAISLDVRVDLVCREMAGESSTVDTVSKQIVKVSSSAAEAQRLLARLKERLSETNTDAGRFPDISGAVENIFDLRRERSRARRSKKPLEEFIYNQVSRLGGTEEEKRLVAKTITERFHSQLSGSERTGSEGPGETAAAQEDETPADTGSEGTRGHAEAG